MIFYHAFNRIDGLLPSSQKNREESREDVGEKARKARKQWDAGNEE